MGRPFQALPPEPMRLLVAELRRQRCIERPLVGWDEIGGWLVAMRFCHKRPCDDTLRTWTKRYHMPITHQARGPRPWRRKPWTLTLLLAAWLVTQGQQVSLPRWSPYYVARKRSQKPSAVRMRRWRAKLATASGTLRASTRTSPGTPDVSQAPASTPLGVGSGPRTSGKA